MRCLIVTGVWMVSFNGLKKAINPTIPGLWVKSFEGQSNCLEIGFFEMPQRRGLVRRSRTKCRVFSQSSTAALTSLVDEQPAISPRYHVSRNLRLLIGEDYSQRINCTKRTDRSVLRTEERRKFIASSCAVWRLFSKFHFHHVSMRKKSGTRETLLSPHFMLSSHVVSIQQLLTHNENCIK